jgi:hypothetical protein
MTHNIKYKFISPEKLSWRGLQTFAPEEIDTPTWSSIKNYCPEPSDLGNLESVIDTATKIEQKIRNSTQYYEYVNLPSDRKIIKNIERMIVLQKPVISMINVYSSFESVKTISTGMVTMPNPTHWDDDDDPVDQYLGVHTLCIVGYSRNKQLFTAINSFGKSFGSGGYCYIPYSYIGHPKLGLQFTILKEQI